jgi:hypothetical protein
LAVEHDGTPLGSCSAAFSCALRGSRALECGGPRKIIRPHKAARNLVIEGSVLGWAADKHDASLTFVVGDGAPAAGIVATVGEANAANIVGEQPFIR